MIIEKNNNDHDTIYIHGAKASDLVPYLNSSVPLVWLLERLRTGKTRVQRSWLW